MCKPEVGLDSYLKVLGGKWKNHAGTFSFKIVRKFTTFIYDYIVHMLSQFSRSQELAFHHQQMIKLNVSVPAELK